MPESGSRNRSGDRRHLAPHLRAGGFEKDDTIAQEVLEKIPVLKEIYNEKTGYKLAIFHLEKATAEFRSLMTITESYEL